MLAFEQNRDQVGFPSGSDMCGLLTKSEIKMAAYWPTSFFGVCLWTEKESRSMNTPPPKKIWGHYSAVLTDQTWTIGLLHDPE